jgi:hypothetical protein
MICRVVFHRRPLSGDEKDIFLRVLCDLTEAGGELLFKNT